MSRIVRFAAVAAVLALVAVACGGSKDTGLPASPTPNTSPPKGVVQATIGNAFLPKEITIKVGEEITWTFTPSHNAEADDGSFNSHPGCAAAAIAKCSKQDDVFKHPFIKAGRYVYFCAIHGFKGGIGMSGTVVVQA